MPKLRRRQLLLAGLAIGSTATGLNAALRRRASLGRQAELTREFLTNPEAVNQAVTRAIEGDLEATAEVERILDDLALTPPTVAYDRSISKRLIQASRLATEQYLTGKFDLRYRGSIDRLPSHGPEFSGYSQVASIKGPDMVQAEQVVEDPRRQVQDPLITAFNLVRRRIQGVASQASVLQWSYPVYWGFVLSGPDHHLLVLRGTQRGHEWLQTINAKQVTTQDIKAFQFPGAIHRGFATIYSRLSQPILKAVRELDPAKPLFLSGHSLGAPLASLAALDIAERIPRLQPNLRLYTYAGPRLGDPTFAEAFSRKVPNTYRVVNQADLVPNLPPTRARGIVYVHAGETWTFSAPRGDIGPNHFISAYREAIHQEQEQRLT